MYELIVDGFKWRLYVDKAEAEAEADRQRRKSSVLAAWVEEV